jgi:excisionase family DNA binding protein
MSTSPERTAATTALTMTVPQAAERLGVSLKTFKRLIDAGEVAYVQYVTPNGTRWIEEPELLRLIEKHRVKATGGPRAPAPVEADSAAA